MRALEYRNYFYLPKDFVYGANHLAYRPTKNGRGNLLVSGHVYYQKVAAVTVPAAGAVAPMFSQFRDISGGQIHDDYHLGGMIVQNGNLYWSRVKHYNVDGERVASISRSIPNLQSPMPMPCVSLKGIHPHKTSGYFIDVHPRWRDRYGSLLVGRTNEPGHGNREIASEGPAAFWFNYDLKIGKQLIYFPHTAPFVYGSHSWKGANRIGGAFFDHDHVGFVSRVGLKSGDWYGEGSELPDNPCDMSKGYHAPPYKIRVFLFDAVTMKYVESFDLSNWFLTECKALGGVTYDRSTKTLYVCEQNAYDAEGESCPVVHMFKVVE